jgi:hypothetical protein
MSTHHSTHQVREEVCGQKTFTEVEDRPIVKERVERIMEHRPVEKQVRQQCALASLTGCTCLPCQSTCALACSSRLSNSVLRAGPMQLLNLQSLHQGGS